MARHARKNSESGTYHILMRGLEQPSLFRDYQDRAQMLRILAECKKDSGFSLYAYTLMDNHVHLLLHLDSMSLESVMKRVTIRYVNWYNKRHDHAGPVFYDRFLSEPVEDDARLLSVLRHIHLNPVAARMTKTPGAYAYDSYRHYEGADASDLVDTDPVLCLMDRGSLLAFHRDIPCDTCLETHAKRKSMPDEEALRVIIRTASTTDFYTLDPEKQAEAVKALRANGLSIRAICRLTGLSFSAARK
jgi:putative transposase